MAQHTYTLRDTPISWQRAGVAGKRFYDKQFHDKRRTAAEIALQTPLSFDLIDCPIIFSAQFGFKMPNSWSKKKKLLMANTYLEIDPDTDNLIKYLFDALTGILWTDDCKIVRIDNTYKYWAEDLKDGTTFIITEVIPNTSKIINIYENFI